LDELPPDDPQAVGSRRDLLRLNAWMGHSRIMARALSQTVDRCFGVSVDRCFSNPPKHRNPETPKHRVGRRLVELGAGDGRFLLRVARRLSPAWQGTTAVLVDRHRVVAPETRQGFEAQGWQLEVVEADALDWLSRPTVGFCDAAVANLFLHHFPPAQLMRLLADAARLARAFVGIEPRRAAWPLTCSHMVWMIGCNRVTQNDAPASVRAGFAGDELSRLWPADGGWSLEERRAGAFSHLFIAQRSDSKTTQINGLLG
jgi:hypothetical protein